MPECFSYDAETGTLTLYSSITTTKSLGGLKPVHVCFAGGDWCRKDEIIDKILQAVCYENRALKSCDLPDGLTKIGDDAFFECVSLESIIIPKSVRIIGACAFCGCESLESIIIPADVTKIGEGAFSWCKSLTKITFCGDVKYIGNGIFEYCPKLQTIEVCSKGMKKKMREYVKSWGIKNVHIEVVAQKDGQKGHPLRTRLGFGRVLHIGRNKGR